MEKYEAGVCQRDLECAMYHLRKVSPFKYRELRDELGLEYLG